MRTYLIALMLSAALAGPLGAIEIELHDVGSAPLTAQQLAAFRAAAEHWETALTDPITVRINIGFDSFGNGSLGATRVQRTTHSYSSVRDALLASATSAEEASRIAALPPASLPMIDITGPRNDGRVSLATANAKALGLAVGLDPFYGDSLANQADASIEFNSKVAAGFDYNPADGVDPGKLDFVALAAREIGHALGFNSMVDLQDISGNRSFTVHPSTLDVWRFRSATAAHDLGNERRLLTAGAAEFSDQRMEREFSRGRLATDPFCDAARANDRCLASYWRDDLDGVMTPTLPTGETVDISAADIYALDAIGYERPPQFDPRRSQSVGKLVVGWFTPEGAAPCLGCDLPKFPGGAFDDFAPPPAFSELPRELGDRSFNLGIQVGLDLGVDGMRNRSGIGFATFRGELANREHFNYAPGEVVPGEQNLLPAVQFPELLPPSIMDFYFRSEATAGAPFTFIAELGEDGAPFDPTIGAHGGYRITGFLDGEADGVFGDIDGRLTFLLAADGNGDPDGDELSIYQLAIGDDNEFFDADGFAFEFGYFVPGDTWPFDGKVDLYDLNNVRNHFGEEGEFGLPGDTPRFDGVVDLDDLNAVRNNFGFGVEESPAAVPEPSAGILALAMLLASCTATSNLLRSEKAAP